MRWKPAITHLQVMQPVLVFGLHAFFRVCSFFPPAFVVSPLFFASASALTRECCDISNFVLLRERATPLRAFYAFGSVRQVCRPWKLR